MQLTRFTDYSLRTLLFLGAQQPDRLCTILEIARAYSISENHLMKVVRQLGATGYVETQRGKGGGIRLARPPQLINVGSVVRDMEDRFDLVECFSAEGQGCPLFPACTLRSVLEDASRVFLDTLGRYTLQDLLQGSAAQHLALRGAEVRLAPVKVQRRTASRSRA